MGKERTNFLNNNNNTFIVQREPKRNSTKGRTGQRVIESIEEDVGKEVSWGLWAD